MKKDIIKYGILAGVSVVAYYLLFYFLSKTTMLGMGVFGGSLLIYAFFMYLTAKNIVEEDFKKLLRATFALFLLANLFYYIFDYTLFNVIDPDLADRQKELAIEVYKKNTPLAEQRSLVDAIRNANIHTPQYLAFLYVRSAIGGFCLAFLVCFFTKKQFAKR
ncbi:MAG: DUF4199 domain-containing protein [Saprospiraceae bacterium]|nr:DUF4199 domain-containing protein [Saprospiraceae bacterium]